MLAFVRVFAFYVATAALLTWGLFALGWADALEMDGFSNTPVVEQAPARPQIVAAAPVPEPASKSALPREVRAPVAEPVVPPPAPKREAAPVVVSPAPTPSLTLPAPALPAPALPAPAPAAKVAAIPQPERAPPVELPRQPQPVKVAPPPPSPPAVEARPAPVPTPPPAPVAPPRQADLAPGPPVPAPPLPAPPAVRPVPPPAAATRAPEAPRVTRWAPVRRVAGFGHDALVDQLEETRRAPDDVPCIVMRELTFKAGTAQFAPKTHGELQTAAKILALFPGQPLEIGSKLGPGRPMASDARLRADRTRSVRDALIGMGVSGDRLMLDPGETYERVADEASRTGGPRVQSIGLCVRNS